MPTATPARRDMPFDKRLPTDAMDRPIWAFRQDDDFMTPRLTLGNWTASAVLLALSGAGLVLVGAYFLLLRPALLPEDIRYMELSDNQLATLRPALELWLSQVFRVMGGYILATGVLTVVLAATAYCGHSRIAFVGAVLGGAASIGLMAVVNFAIESDFKWLLFGMALVWASSLVMFWVEERR